jgi:excisionase family DNA binding protein
MEPIRESLPLVHTKEEAARILRIGNRTLHALIASKKLRVVRVGRRVLVPHAELVTFCMKLEEERRHVIQLNNNGDIQ